MAVILISKIFGSALGIFALILSRGRTDGMDWIGFGLLGILPIWFEIATTAWTGIEPARETRKAWRWMDAVVDGLVFVWVPTGLFLREHPESFGVSLFVFAAAGTFRLVRFVGKGLGPTGTFSGLPVTYTGYVWLLVAWGWPHIQWISLIWFALGIAMVYPGIRMRPSR
jgi:hypothetical protein